MKQLTDMSAQERMVQEQLVDRGIHDKRVLDAIRSTPRDRFMPASVREHAFSDRAAPIGHGQTISQPYMVALMTERLDLRPKDRVLEIGTGTGYQTAILAQLCSTVYTLERVKPLLDESFDRLLDLGFRNIHFRYGDGTLGWPENAPFDRVIIAAGAPELPRRLLLSQLKNGGLAVLPIGLDHHQILVEVRRIGERLESHDVCPCRFVRLVGQEGWSGPAE
jgi:protein-L-isoaspartate(D-aspartate) O-methyltransferase